MGRKKLHILASNTSSKTCNIQQSFIFSAKNTVTMCSQLQTDDSFNNVVLQGCRDNRMPESNTIQGIYGIIETWLAFIQSNDYK